MEFGVQFFPDVGPDEIPADQYWQEALDLVDLCDELGYAHVRTVEHYFHRYGGYSTNPIVFLAAAAQRTKKARRVTGAILPVFNHPLKLAGEIGMLDAISGGRLDVGFARAFLPHEFARHGRSLDESRARFDEGFAQIRRLLEEENVSENGRFHSFSNVTSLPRPTQKPRPPFWVAASSSAESFANAGRGGYGMMMIARNAKQMREWNEIYRDAWREAGHPGQGRVMVAFHMYCAPTRKQAHDLARDRVEAYFASLIDAASGWRDTTSTDYPAHPGMLEALKRGSFESRMADGSIWVGTPAEIRETIARFHEASGGFEAATLQVNFHTLPIDAAKASMRLFAEDVMPAFAD